MPDPSPRRRLWPVLVVLAVLSGWMIQRRAASPPGVQPPAATADGTPTAAPSDYAPANEAPVLTMTSERQPGALDFYSSEAGALYMKGVEAANKGDQEGAIASFSAAIAKTPLRAEPYHDRGLAYEIQGKRELAAADYDRAVALHPDNSSYRFSRGVLLTNLDRIADARADAEALEKLDPAAAASLKSYLQGR